MSVDNSENSNNVASGNGIGGSAAAVRSKNTAAFLAVTVAAAVTPFLGLWGFLALCASYAAAIAACSCALRFAFFLPGTALALFIYNALGTQPVLAACGFGFVLICAAVLGAAIHLRQSSAVQTLSVGVTAAVVAIAAFVSYALYAYGSVGAAFSAAENALGAYLDRVFAVLADAAKRYAEDDPQGATLLSVGALSSFDTKSFLRTLILYAPGTLAGAALVFGWIVQLVSRLFLTLFGRRDIVTDRKRIVLPISLVLVYLAASLVSLFSSGETFLAVSAANVASAIVPAIFCVGVGYVADFFRSSRGRFPAMLVVMFIFSALLMPSFFISLVRMAGVVGTIAAGIRSRMMKNR